MPYFVSEQDEKGQPLTLRLVHATVDMTTQCDLCGVDSVVVVDNYLYLKGELLSAAAHIAQEETETHCEE